MTITDAVHQAVLRVPVSAWTAAVEPNGQVHDGAWVAGLAGDVLKGRPSGMRLIVRKERPHPGAQLRFTDADGMRLTCFATNTKQTPIARLELRHRQRARAEDRIRAARDTGLRNLPLHDTAHNRIWLEIVQLALDLPAWMPSARPDRPRPPLGARTPATTAVLRRRPPGTTGRRRYLRLARHWPWTDVITSALSRLQSLPNPG
ncbi:transposase [Kitasatospora sp. NPDC054768]